MLDKIFRPKTAAEIAEDMKRMLPSYLGYQANPGSVVMAMLEMLAEVQYQRDELLLKMLRDMYPTNASSEHLKQLDNLEICEPLYSEEKPKVIAQECECGKEKHGFASHASWCKKWNKGS